MLKQVIDRDCMITCRFYIPFHWFTWLLFGAVVCIVNWIIIACWSVCGFCCKCVACRSPYQCDFILIVIHAVNRKILLLIISYISCEVWSRQSVCLSVCLSVSRRISTLLHGPGCNLGEWYGCPLVVHYWADLQTGFVALLWWHSASSPKWPILYRVRPKSSTQSINMALNANCLWVLVLALRLVISVWANNCEIVISLVTSYMWKQYLAHRYAHTHTHTQWLAMSEVIDCIEIYTPSQMLHLYVSLHCVFYGRPME